MLEQNCPDKLVFNDVNRLNHSSKINSTVSNKIKRFPQLFTVDPQTPIKLK